MNISEEGIYERSGEYDVVRRSATLQLHDTHSKNFRKTFCQFFWLYSPTHLLFAALLIVVFLNKIIIANPYISQASSLLKH